MVFWWEIVLQFAHSSRKRQNGSTSSTSGRVVEDTGEAQNAPTPPQPNPFFLPSPSYLLFQLERKRGKMREWKTQSILWAPIATTNS